ncbi:MAG TPA: hypothetical protein VJ347_20905 [Streptosporangiaceae bacterium]|nr:hypothetical protein [Streptosporangiaceae bacterium]
MRTLARRISLMAGAAFLVTAGGSAAGIGGAAADAAVTQTTFQMVRSAASVKANCLTGADAKVTIKSEGPVEVMKITADHLPPNTDFDLFVTQVPNAPFGISWYQGDLESNSSGHARGTFIGRFSIETFAVAPGSAPAPQVFNGPFPDASLNPPFNPVQMYHLGLWFNSPKDATAAGCAGATTPFNGEHNAGVQALSTRNFPDQAGPLRQITS